MGLSVPLTPFAGSTTEICCGPTAPSVAENLAFPPLTGTDAGSLTAGSVDEAASAAEYESTN